MAGCGRGQEQVPCAGENTVWVEVDPASVFPPMFALDLQRGEPGTSQEEETIATMRRIMQDLYASWKSKEYGLMQKLKEAQRREAILSYSLASKKTRQEELVKEIDAGKERENELLLQRTNLERKVDEWTHLYYEALSSYQGLDEELATKEKERVQAERAVNAQLKELESQLAAKQTEDEAVAVSQKDLNIIALQLQLAELEEDKVVLQEALDELRNHHNTALKFVCDSTIKLLWDVTQKVNALTGDVEESQLVNKIGQKTTSPRTRPPLEMPSDLPSSWEEAEKMINRCKASLTEATKNWKMAHDGVEVMKSYCREGLLDSILGRKELASETKGAQGHPR